MRPKMSWEPTNCYILNAWRPRPERSMNLYQLQFYAKQQLRNFFITDTPEKSFKRIHRAYNKNLHETLIHVERRLDSILFRSMFASSIFNASNMVSSGKVLVNGKLEKRPGHAIATGDIIQVVPEAAHLVYARAEFPFAKMWGFLPGYLEVSFATLSVILVKKPLFDQIPQPFSKSMIHDANGYYYIKS